MVGPNECEIAALITSDNIYSDLTDGQITVKL